MNLDLQHPLVSLLGLVGVGYVAFYYAGKQLLDTSKKEAILAAGIKRRLLGLLILGLLSPLVAKVLGHQPDWLIWGDPLLFLKWAFLPALLAVPIIALASRGPRFTENYPELRLDRWSSKAQRHNGLSWVAYLLGYEIFFRGVLLFGLIPHLGVTASVAVTTVIYVLVHLPKGASETWGCFPMGVIFALSALQTGSPWAAWVLHSILALTGESLAIRAKRG